VQQQLETKIKEVISIVKNKQLTKDERNQQIVTTISSLFNFKLMAKISLGKRVWRQLSKEEQQLFVKNYVSRMKKSYSSKLDSYTNQKVQIIQAKQTKSNKMFIKTKLINGNSTLEVIYKYYKPKRPVPNKSRWLIYDVVIEGVSIIKTDKMQFKDYLKANSVNKLAKELKNL
jgi:phospholipid transport system substrate-binding protein